MMKAVFVLALLLAQFAAEAADTAYSALRVVGKRRGADALNRVLEVRGRNGAPEPALWKIVLDEPRARGGIRELEVQRGQIISERTPTGRTIGSPMNFNQLNLDSEGAFTVAHQEAEKAGVPFDRLDYLLKSGTGGGAPVWELSLFRGREGQVGSMVIAADTGSVLRQDGLNLRGRPYPRQQDRDQIEDRDYVRRDDLPPEDEDREYIEERREVTEERHEYRRRSGEPIRDVPSLFRRAGRHFERRGLQIKRFFTGE